MSYYGPTKNDIRSLSAWGCLALAVVLVLVVASFAFGWIEAPFDIFSRENVQDLSRQVNDKYEGLRAQEQNVKNYESQLHEMELTYGEDRSVWPQGKDEEYLQLVQQRNNAIAAYNNSCAEYNGLWQDEWRSVAAPKDVPVSCELLEP